jgi:glycogen operon protein
MRQKIPYLKALGINCVELMPVHEYDEFDNTFTNPTTGERLFNYWGYSPIGFFAPKAGYAATGQLGMQADEFKALIRELHENGIAVILDVVFNHTGEGDESGPTISFRGIDNKTYYMLRPDGGYYDFSGCGNTMNCNNPVVRNMVLDCLRYWVAEYHIDGFRFDLASILGRDAQGRPLANPPLLEAMAYDPILGTTKLIAEAWDAGGLYQVGSFPSYGRWREWNGKYRDAVRRFLRGDMGMVGEIAQRIEGSPDLYAERGTIASINFITCHDGFSLADLFSYNDKHNEANGEDNRDGTNDNYSWNCGWEGPTDDVTIQALRRRMIKNAALILLISQGVPLILMGDEVAHTRFGNNNAYCHDNELNWFNWDLVEQNHDIWRFFQAAIAFLKAHPVLRHREHMLWQAADDQQYAPISWHGVQAWQPDWSYHSRTLAFMLADEQQDEFIYVAMNMHWEAHRFALPHLPLGLEWRLFADTLQPSPHDIVTPGMERRLADQRAIGVGARSIVVLVGSTEG